ARPGLTERRSDAEEGGAPGARRSRSDLAPRGVASERPDYRASVPSHSTIAAVSAGSGGPRSAYSLGLPVLAFWNRWFRPAISTVFTRAFLPLAAAARMIARFPFAATCRPTHPFTARTRQRTPPTI